MSVSPGREDFHIKRICLLWVLKAILNSLWVVGLKKSTPGAFAVPFRVLNRKQMTGDSVLF